MARITRAALHVSVEEVKARMIHDTNPLYRQRWIIIYQALVDPREAKDIAKHTGVSVSTVHKLISTYNWQGVSAVETKGKGGRYHAYLTIEEERDLLRPFFERAERGELTTVGQIKHAFEKRVGHEVDETTIHRLLKRQKWRKLAPRPFHPQTDKEEQERFEENFASLVEEVLQSRDPQDQRPVLKMAQDEACFGRICISRRSWAPKHIRPHIPRQIVPENIRLIPQPAYSPELNPVEHIWEEIREKAFSNRAFASLDAVIDTLCDQLRQLEDNSKLLHSMTYFPHFRKAS